MMKILFQNNFSTKYNVYSYVKFKVIVSNLLKYSIWNDLKKITLFRSQDFISVYKNYYSLVKLFFMSNSLNKFLRFRFGFRNNIP